MATKGPSDLPLEIGHVLFIDIVGYSKLLIDDQREVQHELNDLVRSTTQFGISDSAGKLTRLPTGDGMALIFRDSMEAPLRCAIEVSKLLKDRSDLQVRMGIHSGPVSEVTDVNDRSNVAGAGMNIAQRVMDCGDAGHILLSKHLAEDLSHYRHWRPHLHDLGECEVKHGVRLGLVNFHNGEAGNPVVPQKCSAPKTDPVDVPIAFEGKRSGRSVVLLALGLLLCLGVGYWFLTKNKTQRVITAAPTGAGPAKSEATALIEKSIAVLPFENLSSDKENAYFADGIQDEILTRLSKIADLKVISRTSTQHYKSAPENLPEIAKQLGVAHILEGSVQKSGDAVRVNVKLIKATNDSHLWADTYDRKLTDIFSVESEVAKTIAEQLRAKLTGRELDVIGARPTANAEAYDAYLRGLAYTLKSNGVTSPGNAIAAQKYLRQAVKLDPGFALAWALLGDVDATGYQSESLPTTPALRDEAGLAAETAVNLQPSLGEAVMAKGFYYYACLKDYDAAVRYAEQARELLPNSSRIPALLGMVAARQGQWDRNELYANQAERVDPRSVRLLTQHAAMYMIVRRFPDAVRKLDQVLEITPGDVEAIGYKAGIAQAEGDLSRAAALLSTIHPTAGEIFALETEVYQAIVERQAARVIPRMKELLANPDPALNYFIGELRFYLGWAQEAAGDPAGARESWTRARRELEAYLPDQPENVTLFGDLALVVAFLGDKAAALELCERGLSGVRVQNDAIDAGWPLEILARVAARVGESDRAIATLEKLLSMPYEGPVPTGQLPLTAARIRLDPMFDSLRSNPRFQKLAGVAPAPGR